MSLLDWSVVVIYLVVTIVVGLYFQKRASKGIEAYFLGDRNLPWWLLGVSGMATNLDMGGTMLIISWFYMLGPKGFLVEMRGGVVIGLAFLMVFAGKWIRRSGQMTMAEWMTFRFGSGTQGEVARLLSAIAQLVFTVAAISYFAVGSGKFFAIYIPLSANACSLIMIAVSLFYAVISGLYGVVVNDFIQALFIMFATIYISVLGFMHTSPELLQQIIPSDWAALLPHWRWEHPLPGYEAYQYIGLSIMFWMVKTIISGFSCADGPMAQRYLAAKNDRQCGLLTVLWMALFSFRWPLIMGAALLGWTMHGEISDPEQVLPMIFQKYLGPGTLGIMIAALMAAAMSTFVGIVNGGAVYFVRDIYHRHIRKHAGDKELVWVSYATSTVIVMLGAGLAMVTPNINQIWGWLMMSFGGGLWLPTIMRWYWPRLNGYGYATGTAAGIVAAILQRIFWVQAPEYMSFMVTCIPSAIGLVVGTYLTTPTDAKALREFYLKTRPFGFWGAVLRQLPAEVQRMIRSENRRDQLSLCMSIPWQITMFLTLIFLVMHSWGRFIISGGIFAFLTLALYFNWYKHLGEGDAQEQAIAAAVPATARPVEPV